MVVAALVQADLFVPRSVERVELAAGEAEAGG